MGRKGMKSFMKAMKTGPEDDQPEEPPKAAPKAPPPKSADAGSTPVLPAEPETSTTKFEQEVTISGKETRGQIVQRHKKELTAHKKHVAKLGKKHKDEAEALTKQLEERHATELKEVEAALAAVQLTPTAEPKPALDGPSKYLVSAAEEVVETQPASKRVSKAQKRREKLVQKQTERDARIAEENAAMGPTSKQEEEKRLRAKLRPLGFAVHEVRADGHCLYSALEHQLQQQPSEKSETYNVNTLRKLTAEYIRSHSEDFLPFILAEEEEEDFDDPQELVNAYCEKIEDTAAWGGQLEIRALAEALQQHIKVHVADLDTVELGEEFSDKGVLHLCYLRHAFALGEHFNSVRPFSEEDEDLEADVNETAVETADVKDAESIGHASD